MNESERLQLKNALHEINNALNTISMQSELAMMYVANGDLTQVKSAIEKVMTSCHRCSTMSHDLQSSFIAGSS